MAAKNDYQGGNYIVDRITEEERDPQANMEDAAKRAGCILKGMGCATRFQAELLVRELQREEDLWLRLRTSRVGLPTLFSMSAMIVSVLAFFIATGLPLEDSRTALLSASIAALLSIVLGYWLLEFRRFNKAAGSGDIAAIRKLHRSLNAWLLLNGDANEECQALENEQSEQTTPEIRAPEKRLDETESSL